MGKLFKLKWYCNFCKRQCSDENGYKVHCSTFSHQAAVSRYNQDPSGHKSSASNDFLSGFCAVLQGFSSRQKLRRGGHFEADVEDWVDSNLVYQEYIKDRHHVHLSATRWNSVAGFVRFLGQKGIAQVKKEKSKSSIEDHEDQYIFGDADGEESNDLESESESDDNEVEKDPKKRPKWFIKLIDKSPEAILAAKSKAAASKRSNEEESLQSRQLIAVEKRAELSNNAHVPVIVNVKPIHKPEQQQKRAKVASIFEESSGSEEEVVIPNKNNSVLDEIAAEEIKYKKDHGIPDTAAPITSTPIEILVEDDEEDEVPWIQKGLLIKIGTESIGEGKYHGLLGVIDEVIEEFGAQVTVLKNGDQLFLDQDDCLPVSKVHDQDFDQQLSQIDSKLLSTALKTNRCVLLGPVGFRGKAGRVISWTESEGFRVEISAAGSSQVHRKQFYLKEGQFCIYWE